MDKFKYGKKLATTNGNFDQQTRRSLKEVTSEEITWKDSLIQRLLFLSPGFLKDYPKDFSDKQNFVNTTVTGKVGDGGIDGIETYQLSLVSFPIHFQYKPYKENVPSHQKK